MNCFTEEATLELGLEECSGGCTARGERCDEGWTREPYYFNCLIIPSMGRDRVMLFPLELCSDTRQRDIQF